MAPITKKTTIRGVQVQEDGAFVVGVGLEVWEGDAILGSRTHMLPRIEPGDDISKHLAHVNAQIAEEGQRLPFPGGSGDLLSKTVVRYPPLDGAHLAHLKKHADMHWSPDRLKHWDAIRAERKRQAALQAKIEAEDAEREKAAALLPDNVKVRSPARRRDAATGRPM